MDIKLERDNFDSTAEECIRIIKENNIKYVSFWENYILEIVFHPTEKNVLTFEIDLDVLNNWSRSLIISQEDLSIIAEALNLPEVIVAPSMYSTDGLANVIHSSPLTEDWEFEEMKMEISTKR